jgi:3-hydroxyisobutyrate dehydrogenase
MGRALAGRLLEGGHELVVWNRTEGRAGEVVEAGAKEVRSIADAVSTVDVAVTLLANDVAVREVALGPDGIVETLPPGSIYVDSSTVSPALSAELLDAGGADAFAAVPILGSPAAVRSGQAIYLAGGHDHVLTRLDPMLASLSERVRRYPEPTLALSAKLTSNLLLLAGLAALAEAFAVGRAGGLNDDQLRDLLEESPLVAPGLRNRFEGVLTGERDTWWEAALGAKDVRLAAALARSAGIDVPVADVVHRRFDELARSVPDDIDVATIGRLYERGSHHGT